jgi:uncharacterized protein involved in type VI secretion and phage assembly
LPWNSHKRGLNEGASVQRFSYEENLRVSQVLLKEYTFKNPAWAMLYREQGSTAPYRHHQMQHYDYPGRYKRILMVMLTVAIVWMHYAEMRCRHTVFPIPHR